MSKLFITTIAIAAGLAAAAAVHAQDEPSGLSRAQVVAEIEQARADGTLHAFAGEDSGSFHLARALPASTLTRVQVRAELHAAREAGELGAMIGEDSGSFHLARALPASTLTRAQVRAELHAAREAGELGAMIGEDSGSFHLARASSRDAGAARIYVGPNIGRDAGVRVARIDAEP